MFATAEPLTEGMRKVGELILPCVAQPALSTHLYYGATQIPALALWGLRIFLVQSHTILPGPLVLIPGHWALGD